MEPRHIELSDGAVIPEGVLVPCPMMRFANRRAGSCCPPCPHFSGLVVVQEPPEWPNGYRIFCAHPVTRRVTLICED